MFENPAHDYLQRIVYRREGEALIARTEDMAGGNGQDFRYRAAPLNARSRGVRAELDGAANPAQVAAKSKAGRKQ